MILGTTTMALPLVLRLPVRADPAVTIVAPRQVAAAERLHRQAGMKVFGWRRRRLGGLLRKRRFKVSVAYHYYQPCLFCLYSWAYRLALSIALLTLQARLPLLTVTFIRSLLLL